jgi:glycosyltransferase involved in cell wall biosynthesis
MRKPARMGDMRKPSVTVLIVTYNHERFIEKAIVSVPEQDFPAPNTEILVVDDGSTDRTPEIIGRFEPRVRPLQKTNGRQASVSNFDIAKARGWILAPPDADDFFLPCKLVRVAGAFQRNPALGMVYHPLLEWDVQTNERHEFKFQLIFRDAHTAPDPISFYFPRPTYSVYFCRTTLYRLVPITEGIRMLGDEYLVNLVPFLSPVLTVPECFVVYRILARNHYYANERQMPLEARKYKLRKWQITVEAMHKWLADNGCTKKQLAVGTFLNRWTLYRQGERFILNPPERLRCFRHLQTYISCYGSQMTWRFRVVDYINALGAVVVGYKYFYLLDQWRSRDIQSVRRLFKVTAPRCADEQAPSPNV